jgi:hypothetical protein
MKILNNIKKTIPLMIVTFLLVPSGLVAYDYDSTEVKQTLNSVSGFMTDIAVIYSHELEKNAGVSGLRLHTGSREEIDLLEPREEEARWIARRALRSVVRQTVERVDILYTLRTYGERLTMTQLSISPGNIQVQGPSLEDPAHGSGANGLLKRPVLSIRSGMDLTESARPAPTIRANLADFDSKVVYDPIGGGDWQFSLGRPLTAYSDVEMVYLFRTTDEQNLLATFRLTF